MKKSLFILTILFSLVTFSCGIINVSDNTEDTSIAAPSIVSTTEGLVIAPTYSSGASYISIFRYEVSGSSDSATVVEDTTKLIGQITPADNYTGQTQFTDFYTNSSKYYQYYARYKNSHTYVYSKTSGTFAGKGSAGEKSITNNTSNSAVQISLDDKQYILSFASTDITMPTPADTTDSFDVMVGLNNGVNTLLFPMTLDSANSKYTLSLRNVLPDDFLAVALTMKCLVGQTDEDFTVGTNDTTVNYTTYHWCNSIDAQVLVDSTIADTFKIPTEVTDSDTSDFTPSANTINFTSSQPSSLLE